MHLMWCQLSQLLQRIPFWLRRTGLSQTAHENFHASFFTIVRNNSVRARIWADITTSSQTILIESGNRVRITGYPSGMISFHIYSKMAENWGILRPQSDEETSSTDFLAFPKQPSSTLNPICWTFDIKTLLLDRIYSDKINENVEWRKTRPSAIPTADTEMILLN